MVRENMRSLDTVRFALIYLLLIGLIPVANLILMKFSTKRAFLVVSSFLLCYICDIKKLLTFHIIKHLLFIYSYLHIYLIFTYISN